MIYWHVERNSLCIHSQLKSPSSSEVASMIEGVLRHCTEMAVDRQYVDSHGQSVVAFAFTKLLGFQLLPRLKRIGKQRLYRPDAGQPHAYARLQPVLSRPIDWELIRRQYDEMVKYTTALRLGTAEAEAILRRFTRENVQHPTYRALLELGKAVKTYFLCRYLADEAIRREINDGCHRARSKASSYGTAGYRSRRCRDQSPEVPDRQPLDLLAFGQRHGQGESHTKPCAKNFPHLMPGILPRVLINLGSRLDADLHSFLESLGEVGWHLRQRELLRGIATRVGPWLG